MSDLELRSFDVRFLLMRITVDVGSITGMALAYNTEEAAHDFYSFVHKYLTAAGSVPRQFLLEFVSEAENSDQLRLDIDISFSDNRRRVSVPSIKRTDIDELVTSMSVYPFYFLIAGHMDNYEFIPLDPKSYHLFKADIIIDGERITANNHGMRPANNPFTGNPFPGSKR